MKSVFRILQVVALVVMVSTDLLAGTPDQDPVVNQLSTMFRDGKTPSPDSLQPGKTWKCVFHGAHRDELRVFELTYQFGPLRSDGMIPVNSNLGHTSPEKTQFYFGWSSHGLIAYFNPEYIAVRQTAENVLVLEYFLAEKPFLNLESLPQRFPAWTAPDAALAYAYAGCSL
jgi:hypothetical protein